MISRWPRQIGLRPLQLGSGAIAIAGERGESCSRFLPCRDRRKASLPEPSRRCCEGGYRTWCRVAEAATRSTGDRARAEAALVEARKLEDPAWPPQRSVWLVDVEGLAAPPAESLRLARKVRDLELAMGSSGSVARINVMDRELAARDARAAVATGQALLTDLEGSRDNKPRLTLAGCS
jgi:hypothetical protein